MKLSTYAVAILLAACPAAAAAHHGWSSYDETKPITLTGPLTAISWGNPHGTARMKWKGKTWDVILAPVSRMESRGLTNAMIANNKKVTITGYARRDGAPEMRLERVQVGDRTIELR
ncbi:DUF6152 family protein [Allosphingosinicella deserti]|uniref:DUF5666 domain-containing protein n=1 Tax=Allosphingosinicella deserti TaxID=2116704 RepID=A0A2P7QRS7_9SPHN|nr:DUF6152 family protein [Sphingomonas deserti]PSJ40640.1 hypothetical protein C7I55_09995 [Sphingomonas deserti]